MSTALEGGGDELCGGGAHDGVGVGGEGLCVGVVEVEEVAHGYGVELLVGDEHAEGGDDEVDEGGTVEEVGFVAGDVDGGGSVATEVVEDGGDVFVFPLSAFR